jgi:dCMP deaminase
MKSKYINAYIDIAHRVAELSHARRLKVGAVIVKDDVITYGYNGMPSGWDNDCEYREYFYYGHSFGESAADYFDQTDDDGKMYRLKTRPEVLHAESNAVSKMARSTVSADGADMFITHSPCIDCAKLIFQAGVRRVFYSTEYRSRAGVEFLQKSGITVEQISK